MLHRRFSNGLEVVLQENHFSHMFAIQVWIGVGSLDEKPQEEGISHCIEHMLFKGTETFKVGELSQRIEFLGGEMNAYTSFEQTVFYISLPAQHAEEAVAILADCIWNSSFDPEELDREREVILEELKKSEDSPSYLLGRKVFSSLYQGTPAARPIIGYEETIKGFTRTQILDFVRRWYQPNNMRVIAVGDFKAESLMQCVDQYFGQKTGSCQEKRIEFRTQAPSKPQLHVVQGDFEQARMEIAFPAPALEDADVLALDLAAFALGSGESSRLHRRIRDEEQLTSMVASSLYAPKFGGIFELSAMPQEEQLYACAEALGRELALLKYAEPITKTELDRARATAKADRIYSEETVSGQARSLGHAMETKEGLFHDLVMEARMNRLNTFEVAAALKRWLSIDHSVMALVLPKNSTIKAEQVQASFLSGYRKIRDQYPPQAPSSEGEKIHKIALTPQITLIYKQQTQNELMNFTLVASGGLRCEAPEEAGLYHILADLAGCATGRLSYTEMLDLVEGKGAVLAGFSGKDTIGMKFQCLTDHWEELSPVLGEALLDARFPESQLQSSQLEVFESIQAERDSPSSLGMRKFQQILYAQHPYRFPVWGLEENVKGFKIDALEKKFQQIVRQSHWVISGVGRLPWEQVQHDFQQIFQQLNQAIPKPEALSQAQPDNQQPQRVHIAKDREQVHLIMGTLGLHWTDPDRLALDILSNVLGGSGGRFFLKLRDEQSLAYSVSPLHSLGCHRGIVGAYIACSPHKQAEAEAGIRQLWQDLCENGITQEELARARHYLIGSHESDMQRADSQAMSMALMELYGLGYLDFTDYADKLKAITQEDVQRVARRLLSGQAFHVVHVGPELS